MVLVVSRAGVRLAYQLGRGGESSLIFIHGWSCDRTYFAAQFEHFASRYAVATVDLRGHGDSDRPTPAPDTYAVEVLADDVLAVAHDAEMTHPVLVGHSLGGLVALAAANQSESVAAVVMIDPAPITNEAVKQYFRDSFNACARDHDGSWRRRFALGLFTDTDVVRRADIVAGMSAGSPKIAAAVMRAMADFDGAAALARTTVPVLSIGSAAPTNTAKELKGLCSTIAIGQTVGAGHFNHVEVPEQVNPMIERFLAINDL